MAELNINKVRLTNFGAIKRASYLKLGGALIKPVIHLFKTVSDAVQSTVNFFWK